MADHHHAVPPHVRGARPQDVAEIHAMVGELAAFERLTDEVTGTAEDLRAALFGESPRVFAEVAEGAGGALVGFSLFFYTFSTFRGRSGLFVEDLYVRPGHRGHGVGTMLLASLGRRCVAENLGRLEWAVLDWNEDAIEFYTGQGARMLGEWTSCRLEGAALWRLADKAR